jgi:hypothetical protein
MLTRAADLETITSFYRDRLENTFIADGFGRKLFFVSVPGSGANNVEIFGYTNVTGVWRIHSYLIARHYVRGTINYTNRADGVEIFCDDKSIGVFR